MPKDSFQYDIHPKCMQESDYHGRLLVDSKAQWFSNPQLKACYPYYFSSRLKWGTISLAIPKSIARLDGRFSAPVMFNVLRPLTATLLILVYMHPLLCQSLQRDPSKLHLGKLNQQSALRNAVKPWQKSLNDDDATQQTCRNKCFA